MPHLSANGWAFLNEEDGLFILTSWRVTNGSPLSHFIAYNAGCSVLHLGPWREVVTLHDKSDPEVTVPHAEPGPWFLAPDNHGH